MNSRFCSLCGTEINQFTSISTTVSKKGMTKNPALILACWIFALLSWVSPLCIGGPAFVLCAIALSQKEEMALKPLIVALFLASVSFAYSMATLGPLWES